LLWKERSFKGFKIVHIPSLSVFTGQVGRENGKSL